METKLSLSICFLLLLFRLTAQDTTSVALPATTDSINVVVDTLGRDSITLGVPVSEDALDATVDYNADTVRLDAIEQKMHLRGNAFVSYTNITLKAEYIVLDWSKSEVLAQGVRNDTTGVWEGLPEFTEGENQFTANRMRYNFETRKGIVYDAVTEEGDIVVRASRSKFVSGPENDTTAHDIIFSEDAIFTTCTAEHPHFGIRSSKQKVIPNKLVIVGPSNLEIMDVPTPLWLPFAAFPVPSGRSTGLIFPRDYEYSEQWGFGLKQIGWYFPIGDNFNLTVAGDIYLEGTYGLGGTLQYRRRYKYNGNFELRFDSRRQEQIVPVIDPNTGEPLMNNGQTVRESIFPRTNSIRVRWSHNQDAAAHPMNRLGGSINFQTNNFEQRVFNDARSANQNVINSNFTFSRNWSDKPISMSVAFRHSQNTRTRQMNVDFPTFQFQTQALYPFRKRERIGPKRWYEDVTVRYTNEARANFTSPDTTFFTQTTLDEARYGMQHTATAGTSFKILKFFNLNPTLNYREVWTMSNVNAFNDFTTGIQTDTTILPGGGIKVDTTDYGTVILDTIPGFSSFRTIGASVGLTTQIFGTMRFKNGNLRGIRHVIKPSISFGYQPNYQNNTNYFALVRDTLMPFQDEVIAERDRFFNRFGDAIFNGPPNQEMQMSLGYNITNIFEAKIYSRKDSTERNIKLFDNIFISGNYNFAADSLKWSPITVRGTHRIFKGATTFGFNATFDPLVREQLEGSSVFVRRDRTVWSERRLPFELFDIRFNLNTTLTVRKIREVFQGQEAEVVEEVDQFGNDIRPVDETDFLSLFENFSIRHNIAAGIRPVSADKDTFSITTNSLELQGSLALTPNWNVDIGSIGYDFARKSTTYPYLGLRRDLHCWEMGFNWAPTRNTYSFFLRVKPGTLDFIKVPYQRNNADGQRAFQ